MYKKITNLMLFIVILLIFYLSFINYNLLTKSLIDTSIMFIKNVFPFLFITIFLNNLLIEINFPYYFQKIFHSQYLYIFVMSILSGSPTNAIIINRFLQKKMINEKDASIMLSFTVFNSPLFLYYYFNKIFSNSLITLKLFLFIYIINIIIFFIFKNKLSNKNYQIEYVSNNIINSFTNSINKSINSIINIYATILLFKLISDLILPSNSLLRGFIEITQGLDLLTKINLSIKTKELLTLVILSYAGLSIHIQISNILYKYNINYKYFYLTRLLLIIVIVIYVIII